MWPSLDATNTASDVEWIQKDVVPSNSGLRQQPARYSFYRLTDFK